MGVLTDLTFRLDEPAETITLKLQEEAEEMEVEEVIHKLDEELKKVLFLTCKELCCNRSCAELHSKEFYKV